MPRYSSFAFVLKHVRFLPYANGPRAQLHDRLAGASNRRPGHRDMVGLPADVPRHVHGYPGYSGCRDIASDNPECLRYFSRGDELDPDCLPDRRGDRDDTNRFYEAASVLALAVRHGARTH